MEFSGCNFDGEETSIWEVDITTIEAIFFWRKRGKQGMEGGNLIFFFGNQKLLLGWFCMQVQMINLAKKNVWLRMTRFPDDVCNVFCPFHLSQKASLKMNMTFLGTSCQNETLQKSFANRVVPVPSWERSHLPKQRAL